MGPSFAFVTESSVGDTALCEPWLSSERTVPRPVLLLSPSTREAAWGQQLLAGDTGGTADPPDPRETPHVAPRLHNCSLLLMLLLSGW